MKNENQKITPDWKSEILIPIFEAKPEFTDLYWKAWELAYDHITDIPGMPQTPYMDEGFCDTDIWIWDTCFMALFCKYARSVFPGVKSFANFYEVLYGNRKLPKIISQKPPAWTGAKIGDEIQLAIHILDNPPLFAWAELSNAKFSGDRTYIRELLLEKKYLQRHYEYLEKLTQPEQPPFVGNKTCMIKHPHGFFWEGGRSGMDNTPRGRTGIRADCDRPNNPHMLWLDAVVQQGFAAKCISELATYIGETALEEEWNTKYESYKNMVNRFYWDEDERCYYDIHADTLNPMKVLTIASFWPLMASMADESQAEKLIRLLNDPDKFGGDIPLVSLARDDADFNAEDGEYWRGAVWIPTAYMTIKGLEKYGYFDMARDLSVKLIRHMSDTYRDFKPHSIWECYSPNKTSPAHTCGTNRKIVKKDFCGWSALAPISLYIENVIGLHSVDAFNNVARWRLDTESHGQIGVRNFRFGDIITDLVYQKGCCSISSNKGYTLFINDRSFSIKAGENSFSFKN